MLGDGGPGFWAFPPASASASPSLIEESGRACILSNACVIGWEYRCVWGGEGNLLGQAVEGLDGPGELLRAAVVGGGPRDVRGAARGADAALVVEPEHVLRARELPLRGLGAALGPAQRLAVVAAQHARRARQAPAAQRQHGHRVAPAGLALACRG